MSIEFLRAARDVENDEAFLRYARLHLGDGNEDAGRLEIEKAYVAAMKALLESPPTAYAFVRNMISKSDTGTVAHIFLYAHLELVRRTGNWIHDGEL